MRIEHEHAEHMRNEDTSIPEEKRATRENKIKGKTERRKEQRARSGEIQVRRAIRGGDEGETEEKGERRYSDVIWRREKRESGPQQRENHIHQRR